MSRTTPVEALPYPCLTDPFQRHWIQDLATAADLSLFRMQSDIDLINRRPRGQMAALALVTNVTANTFTFLPMDTIDYSLRMGATTGTPSFFAPDLPGIYWTALEFGFVGSASITKINPEVVLCDSAGANLTTQYGRSFNNTAATDGLTVRMSGMAHVNNVAYQLRARVRHQGAVTMQVTFLKFTAQYLGGCTNQLLTNPYFERNASGWINDSASTTLTQSALHAFRGNYGLSIAGGAAVTNPAARNTPRFSVVVARPYHAVTYLYTTVSENYTWGFRWYDGGGSLLSSSLTAATASTSNTWKRYAITATAPASAVTAEVVITRSTATTPPPVYYIDDAEVFEFC